MLDFWSERSFSTPLTNVPLEVLSSRLWTVDAFLCTQSREAII